MPLVSAFEPLSSSAPTSSLPLSSIPQQHHRTSLTSAFADFTLSQGSDHVPSGRSDHYHANASSNINQSATSSASSEQISLHDIDAHYNAEIERHQQSLATLRAQREAEEIMHQLAIDTLHANRVQLMMNHNSISGSSSASIARPNTHVPSSLASPIPSIVPVSAFAHLNDDNRFTNFSSSSLASSLPASTTTTSSWHSNNSNDHHNTNSGHVIDRNILGGLMSPVPMMASLPPLPPIPKHANTYQ
jgi:hypothetical protein